MSEAQQMWDSVIKAANAFFNDPRVKALYEAEAKANAAKRRAEEKAEREAWEAAESEKQRKKSYDVWALNGGSDECSQFGIRAGCAPWCPVFERGDCSIQSENEEIFAMQGASNDLR